MRVRAGLVAVAVGSMAILGCGGDGDRPNADRSAEDGGDERTSADLHLTTVATLEIKIDEPVLTGAGIVALGERDRLVLLDPEDGSVRRADDRDGFAQATVDDPTLSHLVQLEDGRVFASTGVEGRCGWSRVAPATLALGSPVAESDTSCVASQHEVLGHSVYWIREDIQVTPTARYLEVADLDAGTVRSRPLAEVLPAGYTYTSLVGLLRTPDGAVVVGATKTGDGSVGTLFAVGQDLSLREERRVAETEPWLTGQAVGFPRLVAGPSTWFVTGTPRSGGIDLHLVLASRRGEELGRLALTALSEDGGASPLGDVDLVLAADRDTAYLFKVVHTSVPAGPDSPPDFRYRTTIYEVDAA
jgi:hypothetical protein